MIDDGWDWWDWWIDGITALSLFCTHFRSRCNHPLWLTPLLQWWSDRWGCVLGINTSTPAWRDQDDTEIPWDTPKAATCSCYIACWPLVPCPLQEKRLLKQWTGMSDSTAETVSPVARVVSVSNFETYFVLFCFTGPAAYHSCRRQERHRDHRCKIQ